jgi:hypothetical protein
MSSLVGLTSGVTVSESEGATDSRKLNINDDDEELAGSSDPDAYLDRSVYT